MLHKVMTVCCSSAVNFVDAPPPSTLVTRSFPKGSMSASGQVSFLPTNCAQSRVKSNCCRNSFQSSQKSSEMRHICAYFSKNSASESGAGPGEMLSTIGRPVFLIARLSAFISAG